MPLAPEIGSGCIDVPTFTRRECEVILLASQGHNRESMCNQLGIKLPTLTTYLKRIFVKLHLNSRAELACWYYMTYWQPKPEEGKS